MGASMSKILPGLYVGSYSNAIDEDSLEAHGITHILSIVDLHLVFKPSPSCRYLRLVATDDPTVNISKYFSRSNNFIHDARRRPNGSCLVHCRAGISRSVSLCLAYIITLLNLPVFEALESVRGFRHCASPNYGFQRQLREFYDHGLKAERIRFFELFGPWEHTERDLRVLSRGHRNYMLFVNRGFYGTLTAEDDREPEKRVEFRIHKPSTGKQLRSSENEPPLEGVNHSQINFFDAIHADLRFIDDETN